MKRPTTKGVDSSSLATSGREGTRPALPGRMDRETLARRLLEAELELQAAQAQHDGSLRATERYRSAASVHLVLTRIAKAFVSA